ncbi:MAG TPA: hypothetical protein VFD82_21545 [Planctomycetota bacterium]|nr:hypothetical protein [Planctomycetota bacterium]
MLLCLFAVVFVVVPVSFGAVVAGVAERKRHLWVNGCVAIVVAVSGTVGGVLVGRVVYRAQVGHSCERGDALAAALETYRSTHGHYPAQLEALAPAFVPTIPDTCIGIWGKAPFDYDPYGQEYYLSFLGSGWDKWIRASHGTWWCD